MSERDDDFLHKDAGDLAALGRALKGRGESRPEDLETYRKIGQALTARGEPLLAFEVLDAGHCAFPGDVRLSQLMGVALARAGATAQAQAIVEALYKKDLGRASGSRSEGQGVREETTAILARIYKDLGLQAWPGDPDAASAAWERSLELYMTAYTLRMNYYPGINAATLAVLLGRFEMSQHLASEVREKCVKQLEKVEAGTVVDDPYWLCATLGEACVIGADLEAAAGWYRRASEAGHAKRRYGDMGSTRRQLDLLLDALGTDTTSSRDLFPMPRVAVFAGHKVDRAGRVPARFPESLVPRVKAEIRAWLDREDVRVGFASAACGADLLFLEALQDRGGEAHVILPYDASSFCERSVIVAGETWKDRFDAVVARSTLVTVSGRPLNTGEVAYDYANRVLDGLAMIHASQLASDLRRLVVWNGEPGDDNGGVGDVVGQWHAHGDPIDVIPVPEVGPATALSRLGWSVPTPRLPATPDRNRASAGPVFGTEVLALLFADVVGFSKLGEDQIPTFVREFLQLVADLLDAGGFSTEKRNTWGDGLYLVFDDIRDAGRFALELTARVRATPWREKGMPENLGLRTGLHAGPVYLCTDPVTRRPNCIGTHVSHAARIEPITPPGEVYASQAFAALAASRKITDFTCRYVGHQHLAKNYGVYPTYHVTPG